MNKIDKFFIFEDKVKDWIERNRGIWIILIFTIGFLLGAGGFSLFGSNINFAIMWGLVYGVLLVLVELFSGGSGYQ